MLNPACRLGVARAHSQMPGVRLEAEGTSGWRQGLASSWVGRLPPCCRDPACLSDGAAFQKIRGWLKCSKDLGSQSPWPSVS